MSINVLTVTQRSRRNWNDHWPAYQLDEGLQPADQPEHWDQCHSLVATALQHYRLGCLQLPLDVPLGPVWTFLLQVDSSDVHPSPQPPPHRHTPQLICKPMRHVTPSRSNNKMAASIIRASKQPTTSNNLLITFLSLGRSWSADRQSELLLFLNYLFL